jgi:uncharacterized protein YkwD
MDLNGSAVEAHYDADARSLVFTPSTPLPSGTNKVHCSVTFNNSYTFTRDWDATISPTAIADLPACDPQQNAALSAVNEIRQRLGLPSYVIDERLNAAATAHADYLTKNNMRGHGERPTDAGFVGESPASRLEAFGWGGPSWECLAYDLVDPRAAVRSLFDAPYHRLPFLQPGAEQFGFGMSGQNSAAEFEGCKDQTVSVSPGDAETSVPLSWTSHETPDPLGIHPEAPAGSLVGYPIVLVEFGSAKGRLSIESATLTDANGAAVPVYTNSPANDSNLTNAGILIPVSPLKPGILYKVSVTGTGIDGAPFQKTWSFRTAVPMANHITGGHR